MSQPFTFQAANNRNPLRAAQLLLPVLALLSFAVGSMLLSLVWFGVGVTIPGKLPGAEIEVRAFAFILLWPVTMLAVWIFSTLALLLAKRWLLASLSLPVALAILFGVWALVAFFMFNTSAVLFTAFFILLNTGTIWLAAWFLRSTPR